MITITSWLFRIARSRTLVGHGRAIIDENQAVTEMLYFNGVNGETGHYGLQPMSAEALVDHVLKDRYSATRQLQDLQRELIDRTLNEQKVLDIVASLVQDVLRSPSQFPDTTADWPNRAARKILAILLGDDASPFVEDVQALAARLADEPVETVVHIVRLLNGGQGIFLAQWLFRRDALLPDHLRGNLTSWFDQALHMIRRTYLTGDGVVAGDADRLLRLAWIEGVTNSLDRLPVTSLQMLPGTDGVVGPLRRLVRTLRALSRGWDAAASDALASDTGDFGQRLAALSSLGANASWHGVVANLRGVLLSLRRDSPPIGVDEIQAALRDWLDELQRRVTGQLGTVPWVDPGDLSEAGWGIVFPATWPIARQKALEVALAPLLKLRARQAGGLYRVYAGAEGYRPGDTVRGFLHRPPRHADAANPAAPDETGVPYYLLLVGSPEEIPFEFQYQLDVQYAVGRLDFGEDIAAYTNYARNVVTSEAAPTRAHPQVVLFGTENPGDVATSLSAKHLITPLYRHIRSRIAGSAWQVLSVAPAHATKANLARILRLKTPPALLFTATHGMEFPVGDHRQRPDQGALLCQDWTGEAGEVSSDAYFSASDVTDDLNLRGMIWFAFACFGAGTPHYDEYHHSAFRASSQTIAEVPFVAALPKAMLALRDRGALAVVGHVERSWGLSFLSEVQNRPVGMVGRKREHVEVFAAAIERMLAGQPVGAALDCFDMRHAAIATELAHLYDHMRDPPTVEDIYRLAELWTANNDARGYIIIGDPAVRLGGATLQERGGS